MWGYFKGTSGKKLRGWPPSGAPVPERSVPDNEKGCKPALVDSKLGKLRDLMAQHGIGVYLVMEQDEHNSEYVADRDRRIRFLSGFEGSAAFVSIGRSWAELATDSRYHLIAERQLSSEWSLRKLGLAGVEPWEDAVVAKARQEGVDVGVDPRLISNSLAEKLSKALAANNKRLVAVAHNLVDRVWGSDQPRLPAKPVWHLPILLTGELVMHKIAFVRQKLAESNLRSLIVFSLDEIAWLLNLRGGDVPYTPVFKAFLIVTPTKVTLYSDKEKLSVDLSMHEGQSIEVKNYEQFFNDLASTPKASWAPSGGSWELMRTLNDDSTKTDLSPINLRKAVKNIAEIRGAQDAQFMCSLSIVKYLAWLRAHIDDGIDEYEGGEMLLSIREGMTGFMGNSFETISAVGENAAAPHYAPEPGSATKITRDKIYLLDSGSQFIEGSTDITRTVHYGTPSDEERTAYTLVLKGQLAVSSAVFPEGTSGWKLDILARQFLWEEGLDYGHGTGHGIGAFLSIHELPLGIGMTSGPESILQPGHLVSDEPGFYKAGSFGVRLENDILVVPAVTRHHFNDKKYLTFEVLTLVPYDQNLIDTSLLTPKEKIIINVFHAKCRAALLDRLTDENERDWLITQTEPIL